MSPPKYSNGVQQVRERNPASKQGYEAIQPRSHFVPCDLLCLILLMMRATKCSEICRRARNKLP